MVEIKNLEVNLKNFHLQDINISIKEGAIHALLGPSGAGKSTLIKAILGVIKPNKGAIIIGKKDYSNLPLHQRAFGYVPQNLALFPHLSVKENILFNKKLKEDSFFQTLIKKVQIENLLDRFPNSLSGGQRQRVALVRAFMAKPNLLLLDEPFSALDITLKIQMWELLKQLQNQFNITTLLVTHDLDEASFLANQASIIIDGKIEQSSDIKTIFKQPKSLKIANYLGMQNIFKAKVLNQHTIYIDFLQQKYTLEKKLKEKEYFVLIPDYAVKFVNNKENAFAINAKIFNFYHYKMVEFFINGKQFQVKVGNNQKVTNLVTFLPEKFILLAK